MNEGDVLALANFLVSQENLMVNKAILENNIKRHNETLMSMQRQERLLKDILRTLKENK